MTPQQRSTARLRDLGYHVEVVEQTIKTPRMTFKRDLWGFVDLLAVRENEVLAVQVTSASNVSARVRKITDSPLLAPVRAAMVRIEVHGWRKTTEGKWTCRVIDLT